MTETMADPRQLPVFIDRKLPIYDPESAKSAPPKNKRPRKRTVHASGNGLEIVQYKNPRTWMVEATPNSAWKPGDEIDLDGDRRVLTPRRCAVVDTKWAGRLVVAYGLDHFPGRADGKAFDRYVKIAAREPAGPDGVEDRYQTTFCADCGRAFQRDEWDTRVPAFATNPDSVGWLHATCTPEAKAVAAAELATEEQARAAQPSWLDSPPARPAFH